MKNNAQGQMPTYSHTFDIDHTTNADQIIIVARFYEPYGSNGGSDGWEQPVTPPVLRLNNGKMDINMIDIFSANCTNIGGYTGQSYQYGQQGGGYDQHAQYFGAKVFASQYRKSTSLTVSGTFQWAGYFSVVLYYYNASTETFISQTEIIDKDMVSSPLPNPYISGNPSIFSYPDPSVVASKTEQSKIELPSFNSNKGTSLYVESSKESQDSDHKINLYKPDQVSSKNRMLEGVIPPGCSIDYLITDEKNPPTQEVLVLRIKLPDVFIENNNPPKTFENFDCRYLSVSSATPDDTRNPNYQDPVLYFWTVTSHMLYNHVYDGYAYVFFAPTSFVQEQLDDPQQRTPPVYTWGNIKGYLLGPPKSAIVIRYRDPNPKWEGSPERLPCYATPEEGMKNPVEAPMLGEYRPEIFGDSLDNFNLGIIGPINSEGK
jgi:hypothetical protein